MLSLVSSPGSEQDNETVQHHKDVINGLLKNQDC